MARFASSNISRREHGGGILQPGLTGSDGGGLGKGSRGLGKTKLKRHRKVIRDNILGVTKGDIRRMVRRGGVKRISGNIYTDVRTELKRYTEKIMKDVCAIVELRQQKTVTVQDIVFVLNRQGRPIYGFGEADRGRAN